MIDQKLETVEKISAIENPLIWTEEKKSLFRKATAEMCRFHYEKSSDIKSLYERNGFVPARLESEESLATIPAVNVTAMKYFLMTSLPHDLAVLKLTSSGTRGQKTQIWFDQPSLDRVQRMMDVYLEQEGFVSSAKNNYLIFNYDPDQAGDLGIAYTEKNQLRFAPAQTAFYAIRKDATGAWKFEKEEALKYLTQYEIETLPVRIFGMPAFIYEFILYLKEIKHPGFKFLSTVSVGQSTEATLRDQSWILTGGGWKAAEDKKISRAQFRTLCSEAFGIPENFQRDAYGMAEHCAPYFECAQHRLHIPVYNRILIRDPVTLQVLPDGEVGLMELLTPFNAMMPTTALLSTDYGRIYPDACPCGVNAPAFEIIGRAGISKHKGCAITAQEIVRRQ